MKDMKHLLFKLQSFLVLLVFTAVSAYAQKSPVDMNRFIDDLMCPSATGHSFGCPDRKESGISSEKDDPGRENRSVESAGYR